MVQMVEPSSGPGSLEMTGYTGVNICLPSRIMGTQKGLYLFNQKEWKKKDKWNKKEVGNDIPETHRH